MMQPMVKSLIVKAISRRVLKGLQQESGLFLAAKSTKTGYNKAWIRDNVYEAIGLEAVKDIPSLKKTYHALFDLLLKHEYKIDWAIKEKPNAAYKYIHARYSPLTFEEFHDEWGNKQNDAIGGFLFKVGELFEKGVVVFRNKDDLRILQKLVNYLEKIEYWHDRDNGVWENDEEVHASSVGACAAGLKAIKGVVNVSDESIAKGINALHKLLPRESESRHVDLALLSLIYPYGIVSGDMAARIIINVEEQLVKEKGVIRYFNDPYYNNGKEAEWVMGFAWLAKIFKDSKNKKKYEFYMKRLYSTMNWKGEFPELYYYKNNKYFSNENTPLGWSQAMYLVAVS